MPIRRKAWSAWNYLTTSTTSISADPSQTNIDSVSLTYNMNILQHIPASQYSDVLVTMNPPHPPDRALTQAKFIYEHPIYNNEAIRSQERLVEIQGKRGIWYAGAWTKYGFHEDGFTSGLHVALKLGGSVSWEVQDAKFIRGRRPALKRSDHVARVLILLIDISIRFLEWLVALILPARSKS
jgi:predicted NAD/FAD-binding protein